MAECNTCGGYLSIEDKIRLSMKCDANGNVVWQGALLNLSDETNAYILAVESEPDGFVDKKFATNTAINQSVENGAYSKIAFWTKKTEFGRNFFFKPMSSEKYLLKVDGTELLIIETSNVNDVLELGCAVAKDYESDKIEIPLINQTISDGNNIDGWLGAGTVITRLFSNLARTITQTIKIDLYRIDITSIVTYNESVLVEYEGFEFKGAMWLNKHTNTFAGGTGDHIITQQGIYSHNGIYTPHVVLANINKNFMYKNYSEGDSATTQICFVDKNKYVPARILLQPDGYDSAIVLSNHADNANIARQRAVHFGTSDTESPDYGTKGITGRGIKTDWSVFAQAFNSDYPGFFEDQDYIDFLLSIKSAGSQIIPHALTGSGNVTKENRDIYLAAFNNLFGSSNWIDHGLGGGALNYGISSKGWDISDEVNYMLDSFENNGFGKAWSYIDVNQDLITDFLLGFPHELAYYNDHLVMPSGAKVLLWKSSDRPFYSQWLNLQKLIDNCGVINAHDYIAEGSTRQTNDGDSLITFDKTHWLDGDEIKITTGFDNMLADIAQKKIDGQVWNPSNTEQVDFIKLLKNVIVEMTSVNKYKITNNSGDTIQGFTFLICKKGINPKLNGFLMNKKNPNHLNDSD